MGLRVPIESSSSNTGVKQFQYIDVGTSLDGRAEKTDDGRFLLKLSVEKSSVYLPGANQKAASVGGNEISSSQPIVQQFRTQVNLLVRDGQTIQSTVATDPVTGHTLRVDVTLNVIK
jgi:type II secretory pathway component GspD/PulD (secretin)